MSTTLVRAPVPADLEAAHRQFAQWRQTRPAGARIPAPLWTTAVAVARRYGVYRTARLLHLESQKLKRLVGATSAGARRPGPTFVEWGPPTPTPSTECTLEIVGPRGGRVRLQLRGTTPPDVVERAKQAVVYKAP